MYAGCEGISRSRRVESPSLVVSADGIRAAIIDVTTPSETTVDLGLRDPSVSQQLHSLQRSLDQITLWGWRTHG